jgi:hypothetical protein
LTRMLLALPAGLEITIPRVIDVKDAAPRGAAFRNDRRVIW